MLCDLETLLAEGFRKLCRPPLPDLAGNGCRCLKASDFRQADSGWTGLKSRLDTLEKPD